MTFLSRHRSSPCVPPLQGGDVRRRVRARAGDAGSALAGALLALALLVAGAPVARHDADAPRASASHALLDASAPSLHVVVGVPSGAAPHVQRRASGEGAAVWVATRAFDDATSGASAAPSARPDSEPHSVVAAGFDATAPPAA